MGIPAIAPNTGTESPYHKPEDTAEKLDYKGMAQVTNYLSDVTLYLSALETLSDMTGAEEGEDAGSKAKIFRPGLRLNVGSSLFNYRDQFYKGKSILATSAGVMASIRLSGNLCLQPEVLYETKGSEHSSGVFRTHSLTTPVNLLLMTSDNEYVRTYFEFGGYYSYYFGGNIAGTPIDFDNDFNNQEYGLTFGAGFEVMKMVQVGIYFQRGISDLNQVAGDRISHENIYFKLGFLF